MFFTILENDQQITQKENDDEAVEYALSLVEKEKTKILNNLLEEVAFFVLLPKSTSFSSLEKILTSIKDGEQKYKNFIKKFGQSPNDRVSYKNSIGIIK